MHDLESLKTQSGLVRSLGIEFLSLDKEELSARMPVDGKTHQIEGILHGGATAALIETLASVGSYLHIDPARQIAVGTELNVSHISSAREDWVTGTATPVRIGNTIHVWGVNVWQSERLISTGRCSLFIKDRK